MGVEFMEGWAPQYVQGVKQFEPSHSIVSTPLDHAADYPFEAESSTVLLTCESPDIVGCMDTCSTAADGICSDGSVAGSIECGYNTDCTDCGPNLNLPDCENTCTNAAGFPMVSDGVCDEQEGSTVCPIGSDCGDCGNVRICQENNRLLNSPTVCSGPASSICTYQCDPGYKVGAQHRCYDDRRYRGGGCAAQKTLPATQQPFIEDSMEEMVCEGRTGDECIYECIPGYDEEGEHVASPDGVYRGGSCVRRKISSRTILALLCFAGVLLLGYIIFCTHKMQSQREAAATLWEEYSEKWHVHNKLSEKKKERETPFDAEKQQLEEAEPVDEESTAATTPAQPGTESKPVEPEAELEAAPEPKPNTEAAPKPDAEA